MKAIYMLLIAAITITSISANAQNYYNTTLSLKEKMKVAVMTGKQVAASNNVTFSPCRGCQPAHAYSDKEKMKASVTGGAVCTMNKGVAKCPGCSRKVITNEASQCASHKEGCSGNVAPAAQPDGSLKEKMKMETVRLGR